MPDTTKTLYEIKHFYPGLDRQKFWDLFVDNEGWTESETCLERSQSSSPERATLKAEGQCGPCGPEG